MSLLLSCPDCGAALDWSLDRIGNQPMLYSKCRHCGPVGPWFSEPVEVVIKPRGKRPDQLPQPPG